MRSLYNTHRHVLLKDSSIELFEMCEGDVGAFEEQIENMLEPGKDLFERLIHIFELHRAVDGFARTSEVPCRRNRFGPGRRCHLTLLRGIWN